MKTKKFWGIALLACVLSMSLAVVSCGDDDDNTNSSSADGGNSSGGTGNGTGGGATIHALEGTYVAVTGSECTTTVTFSANGSGVLKESKKGNSYSGTSTETDAFTYSVSGQKGKLTFVKDGSVSGTKEYIIRVEDGFVFIEEQDGDIEYILYKQGQNLGSPDVNKVVGTWVYSDTRQKYEYTITKDGKGHCVGEYSSGSQTDREEFDFTFKMTNAYFGEYTYTETKYDGKSYTYTDTFFVLNDKIYLCDEDGEVDYNDILTKK